MMNKISIIYSPYFIYEKLPRQCPRWEWRWSLFHIIYVALFGSDIMYKQDLEKM